MARTLEPEKIVKTLEQLQVRVGERFPGSGLLQVLAEVTEIGRQTGDRASQVGRPVLALRFLVGVVLVAGLGAWLFVARLIHFDAAILDGSVAVQAAESAANLVVLVGALVWSLASWESSWKRRRVLAALHELRSYAHIVDMHQLTKDPTVILQKGYTSTQHSPHRGLTRFALTRYLEYCAEALALIGKLAALYGERLQDAQVLDAVNDVEDLTTSLGRKIWQKIVILGQLEEQEG
jgi:hypothetical protein